MTDRKPRQFTGAPAVRAAIPLWIGLYGPSGGGKTYSALRLAKGIQSVAGGRIGVADTENGRASHYAGEFDFVRYPFDPPFDPLSYLDIIEQMARDVITIAIIDSASHEHEGQGGVLEMHEAECDRLVKQWKNTTRDKVQMSAWAVPKAERKRMIQGALRSPMHIIWCFRAKEKLEVRPGKPPVNRGFMPLGAEELVYEMAMTALLMPGAKGHPTWNPGESGEKQMVKLPHWAQAMLRNGHPLDEELGAKLARWAGGEALNGVAGEENVLRVELRRLYGLLNDERRARIAKAIPSESAIDSMSVDRLKKGVAVLTQAVHEQFEEQRAREAAEEAIGEEHDQ